MMELVKKNMVSIICGVIALLAIGALFWPISGYYAELQTKAEDRVREHKALNDLLTKDRKLPVIDLSGNAAAAASLDSFPTPTVIAAWKAVTDRIAGESEKMYTLATDMNKKGHAPLEESALPSGTASSLLQFRQKYRALMDTRNAEARKQSLVLSILPRAGS